MPSRYPHVPLEFELLSNTRQLIQKMFLDARVHADHVDTSVQDFGCNAATAKPWNNLLLVQYDHGNERRL